MSGIYGTVKPAVITADDVDIFYNYNETRYESDGDSKSFQRLSSEYLTETTCAEDSEIASIPGLYNLSLPLNVFGQKGYYSVYIRPKEISLTIQGVGCLADYTDIRGIVLNADELSNYTSNDALVGYRIEYIAQNGNREPFSRLITSSFLVEGTNQILNAAGGVAYRPTNFGRLIFCTLTPSIASSFKPTDMPYIGATGQKVKLINTKFNPVLLELEMVNHDAETLSYMLEGEQVHDLDRGIITTFNYNREPYVQMSYKSMKNSLGDAAYTVKTRRDTLETHQDITSILGDTLNNE